jgi:hypothetical protein
MSLFYTQYTTIDANNNVVVRGRSNLVLESFSSINITSSNITLDAPKVKLDVDDVNIYSFGSQSFRFVKEDPYNYLQTVDRPMIITGLGGANTAFSFDGTGSNKSFRNLDMCNNNINNLYQLNFSNGANIDAAYGDQLNFNASNSYFLGNLRFYGSNRTLDIADNQIYACRYIYGASSGFLNINAVYGMTIENNQGANILLNSNGSIGITASNISVSGSVNANCNAISNVGTFSRYLISTELPQPVIQYAYVSTTGALTGTITVTLPQRYTSVNSYIPFAVVQNDATTTFYVSTITRATFEIGWSGYTGLGDIIFSWNCLGN